MQKWDKYQAFGEQEKQKATTKNENQESIVTEDNKKEYFRESCEMLVRWKYLLFDLEHFSLLGWLNL